MLLALLRGGAVLQTRGDARTGRELRGKRVAHGDKPAAVCMAALGEEGGLWGHPRSLQCSSSLVFAGHPQGLPGIVSSQKCQSPVLCCPCGQAYASVPVGLFSEDVLVRELLRTLGCSPAFCTPVGWASLLCQTCLVNQSLTLASAQ